MRGGVRGASVSCGDTGSTGRNTRVAVVIDAEAARSGIRRLPSSDAAVLEGVPLCRWSRPCGYTPGIRVHLQRMARLCDYEFND